SGHKESIVGWYHSHPGYGCWLSGIDVNTQSTNQKYQDPFVAVVIDPNRTISAGKVDIGAFRTYPEGYKPPNSSTEYQSIPLSKIEDFGVHANQYYSLDIEIFKSKLDNELLGLLWNKYWVNTLSSSPLISNRAYAVTQLNDLAAKLAKGQTTVSQRRPNPENLVLPPLPAQGSQQANTDSMVLSTPSTQRTKGKEKETKAPPPTTKPVEDTALTKAVRDSTRISSEAQHGLISQMLKDIIFSNRPDLGPIDSAIETAMAS
ncbi:COP9 signalosome catalytic subunit rri1, partial [Tulasnella sp. 403]